jgi:hypothetical protein
LSCSGQLRQLGGYDEIASELYAIAADANPDGDLEELEQRLSKLEERMASFAKSRVSPEEISQIKEETDRRLAVFRSRMTTVQLGTLERQYHSKLLFERVGLPRLSLHHMPVDLRPAA